MKVAILHFHVASRVPDELSPIRALCARSSGWVRWPRFAGSSCSEYPSISQKAAFVRIGARPVRLRTSRTANVEDLAESLLAFPEIPLRRQAIADVAHNGGNSPTAPTGFRIGEREAKLDRRPSFP